MHSPAPPHRCSKLRVAAAWLALAVLELGSAAPSRAIELFEGRIQIHGSGETQVRSIARDFDVGELDLTQWYLIGNVELEFDIAPEGFGPIDLMGAFVRVEGRYDCLWTRACGLFNSVNTYGDRSRRLPGRLSDGRKGAPRGTLFPTAVRTDTDGTTTNFFDTRPRVGIPLGQDGDEFAVGPLARPVSRRRHTGRLWQVPALGQLFFTLPGLDPDGLDGNLDPIADPGLGDDDVSGCFTGNTSAFPCRYPGAYVSERFLDYRFGSGATRGPVGGNGSTILGPWRPKDTIIAWAALADRVNPYDVDSLHPVVRDLDGAPIAGGGELPFRPRAELSHDPSVADANRDGTVDAGDVATPGRSRGLYYPSARLAAVIADSNFDQPKVNIQEEDLAFNQGYAQEQTHELKEAYLDIELLDHALWLRAGRQTIVWGKTELFRSQDQFNPQDLGLSSLPSLEESRVPLWSARAIYSFYNVGPFEDVRLEGAVLIDQFQPLDFGRCGEPYSPQTSCTLASGLFVHGLIGQGVAGQFLPEAPWESIEDFEGGLRLEWRWNRLSFALTEWVGYPDIPHVELLQEYSRNVDPTSGRPRKLGSNGTCVVGNEPACLGVGPAGGGIAGDDPADPATILFPALSRPDAADVRANSPSNQQLFATICASTVNSSALLPEACSFNLWNSQALVAGPIAITFAQAFSAMLQGHGFDEAGLFNGKTVFATLARWSTDGDLALSSELMGMSDEDLMPLVPLHVNDNNLFPTIPDTPIDGSPDIPLIHALRALAFEDTVCPDGPAACSPAPFRPRGLSPTLTVEQEALLGCGDYWGTDCDIHGFDLMNSEASALLQSWPGFEGAGGSDWDPFDAGVAQPGTIGFTGGPVCSRFDPATGSRSKLPGCRGVREVMVNAANVLATFDPGYDVRIDGCVFAAMIDTLPVAGVYADTGLPVDLSDCTATLPGQVLRTPYHPFAGCLSAADELAGLSCTFDITRDFDAEFLAGNAQIFSSELAALSWNLLIVLVGTSTPPDKVVGAPGIDCDIFAVGKEPDDCSDRPPRFDEFDVNDPERLDGCSFRRPFLCKNVGALTAVTAARRSSVRAGGNDRYGRRDFLWQAGGVGVLDYRRRNVLGFSLDFPEDRSGSNWGAEFTWFNRVLMTNNDEFDGLSKTQHFNLSVAVDRPTFVRFLNASRTFLFNGQVFFQYIDGFKKGMIANGPLNVTGTFFAATAYHQDRLIPSLTLVHDVSSVSGAAIAAVTYRYTTHFSVGIGAAAFYGRVQRKAAPVAGIVGAGGGAGEGSDRSYVENGLSQIRDRDELFLRFRYTF